MPLVSFNSKNFKTVCKLRIVRPKMKLILMLTLSLVSIMSSNAAPNLLDAPIAEAGKEVPSVLAGKPKPLLDDEVS